MRGPAKPSDRLAQGWLFAVTETSSLYQIDRQTREHVLSSQGSTIAGTCEYNKEYTDKYKYMLNR